MADTKNSESIENTGAQGKRKAAKKKVPAKKKASLKKAHAAKKKTVKKKTVKKKAPAKKAVLKKTAKSPAAKDFDGNTSIRHLAKLLGYSDRTIRAHIDGKGGPIVSTRGANRAAVVNIGEWHHHFLNLASGSGNELGNAKLAKQQEDLRKQKRENDEAEGKLVPIDDVVYFYQSLLVILSNRLDGIPGKAAGGDPVLRARFLDEIRQSKTTIFHSVVEFLRPFVGDDSADLATAEASQLGVGSKQQGSS